MPMQLVTSLGPPLSVVSRRVLIVGDQVSFEGGLVITTKLWHLSVFYSLQTPVANWYRFCRCLTAHLLSVRVSKWQCVQEQDTGTFPMNLIESLNMFHELGLSWWPGQTVMRSIRWVNLLKCFCLKIYWNANRCVAVRNKGIAISFHRGPRCKKPP